MRAPLIEAKADTELAVTGGVTPLYVAVQKDFTDIIALLLDAAANPNVMTKKKSSPLQIATFHCNLYSIRHLIHNGAMLDTLDAMENNTVTMLAAYSLDVDVLGFLVRHGASLNIINRAGLSVDNVLRTTHGITLNSLLFYWLAEQHDPLSGSMTNDQHDAQSIRELFARLDVDGNETLSMEELRLALEKWGMRGKYVSIFIRL